MKLYTSQMLCRNFKFTDGKQLMYNM